MVSVLLNPPEWYKLTVDHRILAHPMVREDSLGTVVYLGEINGFRASVEHFTASHNTYTALKWGCRVLFSEEEARAHWIKNTSCESGAYRPHADRLIDYVKAICEERGWPW